MPRIRCVVLAAGVVLAAAGCGGTAGPAPSATVTVTSPPGNAPVASEPSSSASAKAPLIKVPNVVGKNHQLAQDIMQAQGLFNLRERDATGANRLLVWDRNWVVVRQSPKAGKRIPGDSVVTLSSKKIGE